MFHLCLVIRLAAAVDDQGAAEVFQSLGIKALFVGSCHAAHDLLTQFRFDSILLDDEAGSLAETLHRLRRLAVSEIPLFVLRDNPSEDDQIKLLQAGAWEVVARASSKHLVALKIIKAAQPLKGGAAEPGVLVVAGTLTLDPLAMTAFVESEQLPLTPRQFDLLLLLATRLGKLVHRSELERLLGFDAPSKRALDMQLCRVRKLLRDAGDTSLSIRSIYGFGYCMSAEPGMGDDAIDGAGGDRPAEALA